MDRGGREGLPPGAWPIILQDWLGSSRLGFWDGTVREHTYAMTKVTRKCLQCQKEFTVEVVGNSKKNAHMCSPECTTARWRDMWLRRTYSITLAEYEGRRAAQGHRCAACPATEAGGRVKPGQMRYVDWYVDHDRRTGKVRGLLCFHCNVLLGHADDDPAILDNLAAYLRRSISVDPT